VEAFFDESGLKNAFHIFVQLSLPLFSARASTGASSKSGCTSPLGAATSRICFTGRFRRKVSPEGFAGRFRRKVSPEGFAGNRSQKIALPPELLSSP
jgi:hypothetical protein